MTLSLLAVEGGEETSNIQSYIRGMPTKAATQSGFEPSSPLYLRATCVVASTLERTLTPSRSLESPPRPPAPAPPARSFYSTLFDGRRYNQSLFDWRVAEGVGGKGKEGGTTADHEVLCTEYTHVHDSEKVWMKSDK